MVVIEELVSNGTNKVPSLLVGRERLMA